MTHQAKASPSTTEKVSNFHGITNNDLFLIREALTEMRGYGDGLVELRTAVEAEVTLRLAQNEARKASST